MVKIKLNKTKIKDLFLTSPLQSSDDRGSFYRIFCDDELNHLLGNRSLKQINLSLSKNIGTIRGLHYQLPPHTEMKFVSCVKGRIWDVAVDLRKNSPTFLKHQSFNLSAQKLQTVIIPEGFAHGFQVLEENSEILYFHTEAYKPASERGIKFDDCLLGIKWPLKAMSVSDRDLSHAPINNAFRGIEV